ncbi:unnamed protein product [Oppiella nova]|uniref:Uncharacterized protein n=1 Tax=Oppiella nova TaxID=334625 RepID=A0A7R9QFZ8_9ACAR|nr:unnamed protein product [Oppiella nova]CAG2165086.1 unnamed protein product [Oppiella nova]
MGETISKSIRIDMRTDPSVYPCLDTFDILVTTNISDERYVRLMRVYTSNHYQRYYTNTLKLDYVREYKLPLNNYLKLDCHFFDANFRYYCFVFVALSRATGAVLITGRPHCRPTTMQMIVTSTDSVSEDNTINPLTNDVSIGQLRPAGPSYNYNYETEYEANNVHRNSRRVSTGSTDDLNHKFYANYFDDYLNEEIAHYMSFSCKCSDTYTIESNVSTVVISLGIITCNHNNNNNNRNIVDNHIEESMDNSLPSAAYRRSDLNDKTVRNKRKNFIDPSDTSDSSDGNSHTTDGSNYGGIVSTICILNVKEGNYKMKVQYENWRTVPVIYSQSTQQTPRLVVREGRLSIDPQLDINNRSQIHALKSQYLRIESFYAQNLSLKLILLKSDRFMPQKTAFNAFLSTLTPIHYTSMALIVLIVMCLMALIVITITSPQRKITVKIVTPSEEGDQTRTSIVEPTDVMSQFSLADDNQSLEMDYYDYLLPFVPRPHSKTTDPIEHNKTVEP